MRTPWCWLPSGSNIWSWIGKRWLAGCDRKSCWMAAMHSTADGSAGSDTNISESRCNLIEQRTLGRTGLEVGRLGMAAGYGVPARAVERAFERGVNYLYWGSVRRGPFGQALRNLKPQRDRMVLVLQSYSRIAALLGPSVEIALRKLNF